MKWERGRQGTGYDKLCLVTSRLLALDLYLLRFPAGSSVPEHRDTVKSGEHYRLNLILKNARQGGVFQGKALWRTKRIILFRPDIELHAVSPIEAGTRWVLSFGFVRGG